MTAVTEVVRLVHPDAFTYDCWYYGVNRHASFEPAEVLVPAGKTVAWLWHLTGDCNVIFEDDPTEPTSSPTQRTGRHLRTFTTGGTYRYRCTIHSSSFTEGMVGTVSVQ